MPSIELEGIHLHYDARGAGEPLLLVHGMTGSGRDWGHVFHEDPSGFRLIVPDMRGHGGSTNPSGQFAFRQVATDLLALLDRLGIDRVKAIGLSGGGLAVLHMATMEPSRIQSMVVVSAPPYFSEQARAIQRQYSETMLPPDALEALRERHPRGDAQIRELFGYVRGMADDPDDVRFTPDRLARVTAKTLVVFGDRDPLCPVSLAFELHSALPRSFLWVVPNGKHLPVLDDQAPRFVETVTAFFGRE